MLLVSPNAQLVAFIIIKSEARYKLFNLKSGLKSFTNVKYHYLTVCCLSKIGYTRAIPGVMSDLMAIMALSTSRLPLPSVSAFRTISGNVSLLLAVVAFQSSFYIMSIVPFLQSRAKCPYLLQL